MMLKGKMVLPTPWHGNMSAKQWYFCYECRFSFSYWFSCKVPTE